MVPILTPIRKYFLKFLESGFIFRNAFVPLAVLSLYLLLLSYFLPGGVNQVFSRELLVLAFPAGILAGVVVLVLWKLKIGKLDFRNASEKLTVRDLILILLPLAPVVQYILSNQDILSPLISFYLLGLFALLSALLIFGMPLLLGFAGSPQTLAVVGLALVFTLINMAALSLQFSWFEIGSLKIQLAVFGGIFLTAWLLWDLKLQKILYVVVAVYFLSTSVIQAFAPHENKSGGATVPFTGNKLFELIGDRRPDSIPNIYLLVYDAYAHNETMLSYGIDNSAQEAYLDNLGFKLYPKTYSIGAASLDTMSRVLNASTEYYGNSRRAASGDGVAQNLLRGFGYETYGLFPSDYFFRGYGSNYNHYFPSSIMPSGNLLWEGVLAGEFKFDLEFDGVPHEEFVTEKLNIFKEISKTPRFVDMHTNVPAHSQNSGICLPDETELYRERLNRANLEMRQDLKALIKTDPGAIIIVTSDHGPYLTKNCTGTGSLYPNSYDISEINRLDIQDRFGTFLAIRWPTKDFEEYDDITVLQDLFPSIFSYLYKDEKLLRSKVESATVDLDRVSGVSVKNGIIYGGIDNGELLFESK